MKVSLQALVWPVELLHSARLQLHCLGRALTESGGATADCTSLIKHNAQLQFAFFARRPVCQRKCHSRLRSIPVKLVPSTELHAGCLADACISWRLSMVEAEPPSIPTLALHHGSLWALRVCAIWDDWAATKSCRGADG